MASVYSLNFQAFIKRGRLCLCSCLPRSWPMTPFLNLMRRCWTSTNPSDRHQVHQQHLILTQLAGLLNRRDNNGYYNWYLVGISSAVVTFCHRNRPGQVRFLVPLFHCLSWTGFLFLFFSVDAMKRAFSFNCIAALEYTQYPCWNVVVFSVASLLLPHAGLHEAHLFSAVYKLPNLRQRSRGKGIRSESDEPGHNI